jgi:catechol 2,3-dioxygenase-like lactoylglutathione lyase family enzyme
MELIHTCLMVRDLERSLGFYRLFGFEQRRSSGTGRDLSIFCGLPGDADRLQLKAESDFNAGMTRFGHIALEVEDLEGVLGELGGHGVVPDQPPKAVGGRRICFVHDPDGYPVELIEETE